jgi:hypothetical protein
MSFVPLEVVAGRLSADSGSEHESLKVQRAAHQGLGTERQMYVSTREGSFIYYLASAASDFASLEFTPAMPLACALPGHKEFRGPGVYYCVNVSGMFTYIKVLPDLDLRGAYVLTVDNDSEESIRAEALAASDDLNDELQKRGESPVDQLPAYRITGTDSKTNWSSAEHLMLQGARTTFRRAILFAGIATVIGIVAALGATAIKASQLPLVETRKADAQQQLMAAVEKVQAVSTKRQPKAAEEFETLVRVAQDQKGYIAYFNATSLKTDWELVVPMSADYDAWKRLGLLKSFERDGMRVVQKGGQ